MKPKYISKAKRQAENQPEKAEETLNEAKNMGEKPVETDQIEDLNGLPNKALFRIDEVASHFNVSERCIRLWIDHKLLIAEQYREKGAIRVTRESILNFRLKSSKNL